MLLSRPSRSDMLTAAAYWPVATAVILPSYVHDFGWARAVADMSYTIVLDSAAVFGLVFGLVPLLLRPDYRRRALLLLAGFLLSSGVLYSGGYALLLRQPLVWGA